MKEYYSNIIRKVVGFEHGFTQGYNLSALVYGIYMALSSVVCITVSLIFHSTVLKSEHNNAIV